MELAREPASTRPKPCASLKSAINLARSPLLVALVGRNKDRGQKSAFPSETSWFKPVVLVYMGLALPWLVDDRAALRLRRITCTNGTHGSSPDNNRSFYDTSWDLSSNFDF